MPAGNVKGRQAAWKHLFHIVRDRFPYSKMKGLTVKEGAVVSCTEVQYTFIFGQGIEPPRPPMPDTFDEQWLRFMNFCLALQDGVMGEVHFTDGRPVLVLMQQAGMDLSEQPPAESRPQGGDNQEQSLVAA
jgi:hypothetical protein